jgi:hypothetical protein
MIDPGADLADAMARADQAMYARKATRRRTTLPAHR